MLEKTLERKLVKEVNDVGGICLKMTNYKGIPDRLVLYKSHAVFVELKQLGKTLRPEQEVWKRKIESLGFKHFVIDSADKISSLISLLKGF